MNANNKTEKETLDKNLEELKEGLNNVKKRRISNKQDRGTATRACEEDTATPQTFEELDNETIETMEKMIKENKASIKENNDDSKR